MIQSIPANINLLRSEKEDNQTKVKMQGCFQAIEQNSNIPEQYLPFQTLLATLFDKQAPRDILTRIKTQLSTNSTQGDLILFNGVPGSGKSCLIKSLIEESELEILGVHEGKNIQTHTYKEILDIVKGRNAVVYLQQKLFCDNKKLSETSFRDIYSIIHFTQENKGLVILECSNDFNRSWASDLTASWDQITKQFPLVFDLPQKVLREYRNLFLEDTLLLESTEGMNLAEFHVFLRHHTPSNAKAIAEHIAKDRIISDQTINNILGRNQLKGQLNKIIKLYNHRNDLERIGAHKLQAYIFSGLPGTGKTHAVSCLSGELKVPIVHITAKDLEQDPIKSINEIFSNAKAGILFIDEAEKFFGKEIMQMDNGIQGEIQQIIDGVGSFQKEFRGLLILNVNNISSFAPSLIDRFETIEFNLPSEEDRKTFLESKMQLLDKELLNKINMDKLIRQSKDLSYRQIQRLWSDTVIEQVHNIKLTKTEDTPNYMG